MSAMVQAAGLVLRVTDDRAGPEELDRNIRLLRRDLLALDVGEVRTLPAGPAPPASRGADAGVIAALSIMASQPEVLVALIEVVRGWLAGRRRTARLEVDGDVLEVTGVTSAQQQQLIDAWLARRGKA